VATGKERLRLLGHESGKFDGGSFASGVAGLAFTPDGKFLVSGGGDTTALVWKLHAVDGRSPLADALWRDLADDDPKKAFSAICYLTAMPRDTVTYFDSHLPPARAPDAEKIAALIADLDSDQFDIRSRAFKELDHLGETAVSPLRAALEIKASAELRRQAEKLIAKATGPVLTGDRIRELRAVEALETIRTAEACELLKKLAGGEPNFRLSREAKSALQRLERLNRMPSEK
jgi:hypothetical protein